MVVGLISRAGATLGTRAASVLGSSTGRAAATGAAAGGAGGMLLDDVPFVGGLLDPTESGGGGGQQNNPVTQATGIDPNLLIIGAVVVLVVLYQMGD